MTATAAGTGALDVEQIRSQFPVLNRRLAGKPIVFADNAATSLKPACVISAVQHYYTHVCANVHRGVNVLAEEADRLYEEARKNIADLIHADPDEIVFVRNATEGINLAAHMLDLRPDDEIVCSLTDHHSNFLPWFVKAKVRLVSPNEQGCLSVRSFMENAGSRTRLIALGHVSNVTGMVSPVAEVIQEARKRGIMTLVDAAQSVTHMPINVKELGCDFLAFSGHKMLGPSGIGALYAKRDVLERALPMLYGGGMVSRVTQDGFEPEPIPHKFEAGTPNIEGALGMGAAARFLSNLGMENVYRHSRELADALIGELSAIEGIRTYPRNASSERMPIASFSVGKMSENDVAAILCNRYNIMVRSGVHCAEPLLRHFGAKGLARISLYLYNTLDEVAYIGDSLRKMCIFFA